MRCALGCQGSGDSLHRFPNPDKYPEQFKAWVSVMGGKLEGPEDHLQYKVKRICGKHFKMQDRNRNNRLNCLAVPSLHLPMWCTVPDRATCSTVALFNVKANVPDMAPTSSVAPSNVAIMEEGDIADQTTHVSTSKFEAAVNFIDEHAYCLRPERELIVPSAEQPAAASRTIDSRVREEHNYCSNISKSVQQGKRSSSNTVPSYLMTKLKTSMRHVKNLKREIIRLRKRGHSGDVSVVAWKDVKLVTTVSTYHNADMAPGRRAGQEIEKPKVVHEYNEYMGGVDLKDQKLSMYLLERKRGTKWYIKVFRRLFNISILNCYVIYCSNTGQNKKMTHRQFRYMLAEELCAQTGTNVAIRQRHSNISARLDKSLDHYPEHVHVTQERTAKQVRFQRGRCVRCAAKKVRTLTNLQCSHCKVFLCVGQCWKEYHSLDNV